KIYACKTCGTHLTHSLSTNLVSTSFTGNCGKAFLFRSMYNTIMTEPVKRSMTTGEHVVSDLKCSGCEETIGWKYLKAYNQSQKYKEGCFILE
ncbi:yippee-like protein, partial [Rhizoclosmatium globosum]